LQFPVGSRRPQDVPTPGLCRLTRSRVPRPPAERPRPGGGTPAAGDGPARLHRITRRSGTTRTSTGSPIGAGSSWPIPSITSYDGLREENCWGFWMDEQIHEGRGEVQDLGGIIEEVRRDYGWTRERIHIAGLSSGAGMAVGRPWSPTPKRSLPAVRRGVCPTARRPPAVSRNCWFPGPLQARRCSRPGDGDAEMGREKRPVPLLVIHSTADCAVNIRAGENLRDSWGRRSASITAHPCPPTRVSTLGTRWTHARYGARYGGTLVETLFLEGLPQTAGTGTVTGSMPLQRAGFRPACLGILQIPSDARGSPRPGLPGSSEGRSSLSRIPSARTGVGSCPIERGSRSSRLPG